MNMIQTTGATEALVEAGRRYFALEHPYTGKPAPSPKRGETFKLVEALKPTIVSLEVCKALNVTYPPILLTYKGQASGAVVQQVFNL